jgi:glycosyltransferase involved in cell wall biosynthesis
MILVKSEVVDSIENFIEEVRFQMKAVFAHDHIFYKYLEQYYSHGELSQEMLLRYTSNFGKVMILTRQKKIEKLNDRMSISSIPRTEFIEIPNFKSLKRCYKINEARRILEKEVEMADCVIARVSSIGLLAIECAIKKNKPYIVEVTACSWDTLWNYGNLLGKLIAPYYYFKTKKLIQKSQYVIYVTNKFLQKRYPTLGVTTECSNVVISDFDESIIEKRVKKITCNEKRIILGTIGALSSRYKGFDTVIKALSILKRKTGAAIEYRLLGGGDSHNLRKLAIKFGVEDLIRFDGTLPSGKPVLDWLDDIDVYIQPSRAEGLPRAAIEAMSRGCPVIGSDAGGIPELLSKNCIFHKSNYKQLAEIIYQNVFNKDWLEDEAQRNFKEAKKYDKEKIELRRNEFFRKFACDIKVYN